MKFLTFAVALFVAQVAHAAVGTLPITVTAPGGQTVAALSMVNGPPNIPTAAAGSCDTRHCTWIGTGNWPSGTHVSLIFADMSPMSVDYGGGWLICEGNGCTPSGTSTTRFSITDGTQTYAYSLDGTTHTRHVGEVKTAQANIAVGDYPLTIAATGAGGSNTLNTMVHVVSGTTINCGNNSIPTSGTVILAPGCTFNVRVSGGTSLTGFGSGWILLGAGNGSTILDGGGDTCYFAQPVGGDPAFIGITVQNYNGSCQAIPGGSAADVWQLGGTGVIRNTQSLNVSKGYVLNSGGAFLANNYTNHTNYAGIRVGGNGNPTVTSVIIGNEVSDAMYNPNADPCNDASNKIVGQINLVFQNNYWHDSSGGGPWSDFFGGTIHVTGDSHIRVGDKGYLNEQTRTSWEIDHTAMVHGAGYYGIAHLEPPVCGGEGGAFAFIQIDGGSNTNVHDNNFSVFSGFSSFSNSTITQVPWRITDELGNNPTETDVRNNTATHNTVNFFTTDSAATWGSTDIAATNNNGQPIDTSGTASNNNHFHLIGGNTSNDQHWYWNGMGNNSATISVYRSQSGQDPAPGSTVDTVNTAAPGCQHVACSGSGVGADGVPQ